MSLRTDLALELKEKINSDINGIKCKTSEKGNIKITEIEVISSEGEKNIGRKRGKYITLQFPSLFKLADYDELKKNIVEILKSLLPERDGIFLVSGLGNTDITPDAVGPFTAEKILATRHIAGEFAENIGLKGLRSVSVIAPGVLGKTGIETVELIKGVTETVAPTAVIVIDALAASSTERLFKTVQISNTGISPGSGVKNSRAEISCDSIGVPVIAIGVPTVVDINSVAFELTGKETEKPADLVVTPKDVDLLTEKISEILSSALNVFLQPELDEEIIQGLI